MYSNKSFVLSKVLFWLGEDFISFRFRVEKATKAFQHGVREDAHSGSFWQEINTGTTVEWKV